MKEKDFKKEVCRLLEYGIEQYGTRYDAQSKLIYHYWIIGYTKEQTKEALRDWYHSHNHQSRTWQTHPESALKNANNAVESLYNNKKRNNQEPYRGYGIQLRVGDVSKIISITPDYRMEKFIYNIVRYANNKRGIGDEFDLPWEAIIKLDCCSDRTYQEKIEFCKSIGILELYTLLFMRPKWE
jgi:hypothetical protein